MRKIKTACETFREVLAKAAAEGDDYAAGWCQDFDQIHQACRENTGDKCKAAGHELKKPRASHLMIRTKSGIQKIDEMSQEGLVEVVYMLWEDLEKVFKAYDKTVRILDTISHAHGGFKSHRVIQEEKSSE